MLDDTTTSSPAPPDSYGPALVEEMCKISEFRVTRFTASRWAQSLSFLVYDDTDDTTKDVPCPRALAQNGDENGSNTSAGHELENGAMIHDAAHSVVIPSLSATGEHGAENHDQMYSSKSLEDHEGTDESVTLFLTVITQPPYGPPQAR